MRITIAILAILFAPMARAEELPLVEADQLAAARETVHVVLFDMGIYDSGVDAAAPGLVDHVISRVEHYRATQRFSPGAQAAIDQFLTNVPELVRSELRATGDVVVDEAANRTASLFSPEEWQGIAVYLGDEDVQQMLFRVGSSGNADLSLEEWETSRAFYATAAGRAYAERDQEFFQVVVDTMNEQLPLLAAQLTRRINSRFCAALAEECPSDVRRLSAPD